MQPFAVFKKNGVTKHVPVVLWMDMESFYVPCVMVMLDGMAMAVSTNSSEAETVYGTLVDIDYEYKDSIADSVGVVVPAGRKKVIA